MEEREQYYRGTRALLLTNESSAFEGRKDIDGNDMDIKLFKH